MGSWANFVFQTRGVRSITPTIPNAIRCNPCLRYQVLPMCRVAHLEIMWLRLWRASDLGASATYSEASGGDFGSIYIGPESGGLAQSRALCPEVAATPSKQQYLSAPARPRCCTRRDSQSFRWAAVHRRRRVLIYHRVVVDRREP